MTHEKAGQGCEAPRPALGCVAVAADTPENKTGASLPAQTLSTTSSRRTSTGATSRARRSTK